MATRHHGGGFPDSILRRGHSLRSVPVSPTVTAMRSSEDGRTGSVGVSSQNTELAAQAA